MCTLQEQAINVDTLISWKPVYANNLFCFLKWSATVLSKIWKNSKVKTFTSLLETILCCISFHPYAQDINVNHPTFYSLPVKTTLNVFVHEHVYCETLVSRIQAGDDLIMFPECVGSEAVREMMLSPVGNHSMVAHGDCSESNMLYITRGKDLIYTWQKQNPTPAVPFLDLTRFHDCSWNLKRFPVEVVTLEHTEDNLQLENYIQIRKNLHANCSLNCL